MNIIVRIINRYPILRGMAVYSILSPSANAFQQIMDPQRKNFEPKQCVRFGLVEVFLIAPSLYGWIKIASVIVRGNTFKHSMVKAYLEQFLWTPFGYLHFFLGINLLEGKSFTESLEQLREKFWTAYKVGFCIWPLIQSINFWLISEKNRVPFASMCAFLWQVFLSYVHNRRWNIEEIEDTKPS